LAAASDAAAKPARAPEPAPLRVATAGISGNLMTAWATYEGGYFQKHGLHVDSIPDIAASTTAVQAVIARDIDVIYITVNAAIEASLKGAVDLVAIATTPPGTGFWLYAAPEYRSLEDLRGKRVAANQVGTSTYYAVEYVFRERGMELGRDLEVLTVGNQAAQVAALQQGEVQAGVFSAPTTIRARQAGFIELVDLNYVPFNANSPVVRRQMLADPKGRDVLQRFTKATVEAIARLRQDREFAYQVLRQYLKIDEQDALDEVYAAYLPKRLPLFVPDALPPVLEAIARRDPTAVGVRPERFYDNTLVEELQQTGFVDSLYR
jgi:ABC-type nitrate/sulfonate/bicarbonate transport system substrate-binding protein